MPIRNEQKSISNIAAKPNLLNALMVYQNRAQSMDREVVVNSASLEDVPLSELSDNRAQSIQSLHSVETPTPDTSPSFEELQQRLENSNRNIQNMQEQQQQLLRLQNAAKQHLSEMEHLRQQAGTLSFGVNSANGTQTADGAPEYESIDQVHSDMETLVGRMKNLTTFIQNQNELSNLLGDDGPEILAEQEALQRKLESLRAQRDDMRTLVSELQDINRTAERRVGIDAKESEPTTPTAEESVVVNKTPERDETHITNGARVVPVTYARNVPIKLTNGSTAQASADAHTDEDNEENGDLAEKAAAAMLIHQKVADIETMRKQLQRLRDMMETVNIIEARTSRDVNDIGRTPPRELRSQSQSTGSSFERDSTPVSVVPAHHVSNGDDGGDDVYLTRKMRMINDVTADLRAQAASLQAERDRIKALKEEIVLRKQQAAAAAQLGEDALKRSSLTPTPTPRSRKQREADTPTPPPPPLPNTESDQLKREYEAKKKEFEIICQRLQQDGVITATEPPTSLKAPRRHDTVSEADDEADGDEELNDSDFATSNATSTGRQYFSAPHQQSTPAQQHRAAAKAAVTAHTLATSAATAKVNIQHSHHNQGQPIGKDDSFETNLTSSTAGERRHSTLANATSTTQDGASLEAGSVQSGSSQFSMPPQMPAMGVCSSWPPLPPMPNTWNPTLYYGFGAPPHPSTASQPNSATTTQSAGPSFTPGGLLPQSAVNSECICSAANSASNAPIVTGPTPTSSSTNTAAQLAADPVLLQQFVQTQQMLINSVCQCNQMLWHQQREIDALNNTIHVLQERLLALTGSVNSVPLPDMPYTLRAESVPPPGITTGTLPNNLYLNSTNRAQSEQPALFMPGLTTSTRNSAFSNYQRHQQQQFQQHQQRGHISTAYSSETQQHSNIAAASSTNTGLYSNLNNAAQAPPPPPNQGPSLYNNELPQSPPIQGNAAGPGPIFMHHHNNAIHQNNANLRTQNHYANNLHQQQQLQQQQHGHSNINVGGGNTLNNQVPPGNRANNYWDNFRSYSRQNLLSTNSNKSNEEQQQQNQQQQHQHQLYIQQRLMDQLDAAGPTHYSSQQQLQQQQQQTLRRATAGTLPTAALTTSNLQQLQRQQQQQEEAVQQQQQPCSTQTQTQLQPQPQPQLYRSLGVDSNSNSCNNLNFERNANENKYLRTLQRSHINRYQQQQQQQQQQNPSLSNSLYSNHNKLYQPSSWLPPVASTAPGTNCADTSTDADNVELDAYDSYNIIDSDLAAPYAHLSSNMGANANNILRNMNVNFGNSPHYQRNKVLTKPNCRGAEAMEQHNPNRAVLQQQQQQQHHQRMLTQHQLALRAQHRLDQSTLLPLRNMAAFTQSRYLDLLPATVSEAVASAEVQLRNRERVDMLLRTVSAEDDEDVVAALATSRNMGGPYMSANANDLHLLDSNEIGNNTPNIDNEDADMEADGDGDGELEAELNADMDVGNDEEDDDTTSEEIKRNLLVNALKNDKFTTKFYESIKEDVFRRLERMLLEKETTEINGRLADGQIRNGLADANDASAGANAADGCAEMSGASSLLRDPTRKFNLNARMGNQQQQQRMQQYKQQQEQQQQQQNTVPYEHTNFAAGRTAKANTYENKPASNDNPDAEDDQHAMPDAAAMQTYANNRRAVEMKDNAEEDEDAANNADTESNKADNEDAAAATASGGGNAESEQPEEDDVSYNNNNNNNLDVTNNGTATDGTAQPIMAAQNSSMDGNPVANWRQNILNHVTLNSPTAPAANTGKKLKNQAEPANNNSGAGGDAQSTVAGNNNMAANNMHLTYYSELITYIITRIRNQTHTNTQINDTVLVEIAKLTACAVQKFTPTLVNYKSLSIASPAHISPKKFYMKIKKLAAPRQRDEFLQWYQNYLENLFPGARLEAEKRRADELRNASAGGVASGVELELPRRCDKLENQQQEQQRHAQQQKQLRQPQQQTTSESSNKDNNDEDLAEADQNSVNSSSNSSNIFLLPQATSSTLALPREKECENNENPDADESAIEVDLEANSAGATSSGSYDLMPLSVAGAGAGAAAVTVTDETIFSAVQQQQHHNLLRFGTDTASGGVPELEPDETVT
ncbi:uncharacterized protein LOC101456504 isoform X2 [Ceratitis capitata]|uniref:(Mediterranean fruit fly) hypothetical protein n=2 Tax=Ceratitis capitata TaxID=7213 RepID=A0A811V550_CERCA|nr:uncharacterized protein LOC101456504 isoform X2 [Ceratitis capitata]XP_012155671.1 uncharacterized protein LOC101456504 isoform X2 [Ceratitis capitata]CAD7005525.1 unnamed protein product [Ceratitis capitata]